MSGHSELRFVGVDFPPRYALIFLDEATFFDVNRINLLPPPTFSIIFAGDPMHLLLVRDVPDVRDILNRNREQHESMYGSLDCRPRIVVDYLWRKTMLRHYAMRQWSPLSLLG